LAPFGTNIFVSDVGDDVEYLTTRGEWVKAQICEIQDAFYVILYMENSDLVEKRIARCSKNLARYGEHTAAVSSRRHKDAVQSRRAESIRG